MKNKRETSIRPRDLVRFDLAKLSRRTALRGLLRSELAKESSVSTTTITCAFAGRPLGVRAARAIAKALGCSIVDLVAEETEPAAVAGAA